MAVSNKEIICNVLLESAEKDDSIYVLCSDSRGSGSMTAFFDAYPDQAIEIGIAEQALVGVSAGLASCGKRPFAVSPSSFLSARAIEQVKLDVAYSNTNVKLIGISGGVSYGPLGQSHHSVQDIAMTSAIPNLRVFIPSDRFLTKLLTERLVEDNEPAFVRVGRNATDDVYDETLSLGEMQCSVLVSKGDDVAILTCGELVSEAKKAADELRMEDIACRVVDMFSIKPLDEDAVIAAGKETKAIITLEEHSILGGLSSMVCTVLMRNGINVPVRCLGLPDEPLICGKQKDVWQHYGLDQAGILKAIRG